MKKNVVILIALGLWLLLAPRIAGSGELTKQQLLHTKVESFLESKHSPLAAETDVLLAQKHWQLIIAISAIESSYCLHSIGNNCWGIKGGTDYKSYPTLRDAIPDVERLIEYRQSRGQWLTIESMNCSYVVPCNANWVRVVNLVMAKLNS